MTLILVNIGQCDVTLWRLIPIKIITSILKVSTYIVTSITADPFRLTFDTSDNVCLNIQICGYSKHIWNVQDKYKKLKEICILWTTSPYKFIFRLNRVRVMVFKRHFQQYFSLYGGGQFYWCRKPECLETTTNPDKLYQIMLYRVHLTWAGFELTTLWWYRLNMKTLIQENISNF